MRRALASRYRYGQSRLYSSKNDDGYLIRRLEHLKEQNTVSEDDPLVKLGQPGNLVDTDEKLSQLHESLPQKSFEGKFQSQLQYARVKDYVNRQSKDIALSKPWTGEEDAGDTSLRMLVDSVGKPTDRSATIQNNLGFTKAVDQINEPRAVRASRRVRRKLEDAQDSVLKYQMDRGKEIEDSEQSEFRTLYAEKFTPIGSFEKLRSLADQRIEDSRRRGGFDNLEDLRGKPAQMPLLNQHVGRTEHHLNNMLVRQNITPPWIESQGRVNGDVTAFRKEAYTRFENELISCLRKRDILRPGASLGSITSAIIDKFGSLENFIRTRWSHWKASQTAYFQNKTNSINSNLRSYNLQAPLSTQKLYLQTEREFTRVFKSIDIEKIITDELKRQVDLKSKTGSENASQRTFSLRNIFGFR